ncbi:hypothetical protein [Nocardia sp. NPDC051570]|uniref:hypothetical protein n=1 Tax=Nocardia sp. NPDC051570 TaxID=3364324 RepID=UPI0037A2DF95
MPGGPFVPLPCRKCGSTRDYYSSGLCQRCHRFAPQVIDSCLDCLGWGVTRHSSWLCEGCRGWRRRFPTLAPCPSCQRVIALNAEGICRLCWRQIARKRPHGGGPTVLEANQFGQQLFLVDLFRRRLPEARQSVSSRSSHRGYPVAQQQLVFFELPRDLVRGRDHGFPDPPDPQLAQLLDEVAIDHARQHGWSKTRLVDARKGVRILLALQDTAGAAIKASEVAALEQISLALQPVREILASADMFDDDREPSIVAWFERQIADLPEPMREELRVWFEVSRLGSTTPPRFRPRAEGTVRVRAHQVMPIVHEWAEAGHQSLREITRDHIRKALPKQGSARSLVGQSLRSLFRVLKARRIVFINPTTHFRTGRPEARVPLLIPVVQLRESLLSDTPARAAVAGLVGFHALRNQQLRSLLLTDVQDGYLRLPDRTVLLAPPVRERLAVWLDYRAARWPDTANPHLLINMKSGVRTGPVSHAWINSTLGISSQAVREDRILHEALATGGDVRRLCDLFGLSVKAAERYTDTLDHPGLGQDAAGPE